MRFDPNKYVKYVVAPTAAFAVLLGASACRFEANSEQNPTTSSPQAAPATPGTSSVPSTPNTPSSPKPTVVSSSSFSEPLGTGIYSGTVMELSDGTDEADLTSTPTSGKNGGKSVTYRLHLQCALDGTLFIGDVDTSSAKPVEPVDLTTEAANKAGLTMCNGPELIEQTDPESYLKAGLLTEGFSSN